MKTLLNMRLRYSVAVLTGLAKRRLSDQACTSSSQTVHLYVSRIKLVNGGYIFELIFEDGKRRFLLQVANVLQSFSLNSQTNSSERDYVFLQYMESKTSLEENGKELICVCVKQSTIDEEDNSSIAGHESNKNRIERV